ncbi:hypothetical protein JZO70_09845 [Enterococcus sp. 669A]|uniref:SpaA-like prealbumin fold domain-containing protein n=1 Tax=Candidatus Enterococcus moelleringii TaxID=2815325 RepID=A0ABS3LA02_9ENTE|nr:prealbumin-like fold domain-containing protein [Enterococcus sp. 669A]MBO1306464.1 hypothetical protein [Enterococcus sp. 669A]
MKKKFSIIGTIIYLTCLLFPMFQPVLTAVAEDKQPQLFTVSHNGAEIKADQEIEASDNNIIQIQATGNFTLKIPQSESYEIGLLTEEEQQELKNNAKETDKLSFDVTAGESDYQLQLEKGMKAYFKVNLLAEAALLEGTASFEDVNLPETKVGIIHLVQPAQPEPEVSESQEEEAGQTSEATEESIAEETTESSSEEKKVIFYKDGETLDAKKKLTVEEGKSFNPTKNIEAKAEDGSESYEVKAKVYQNDKELKLKKNTFKPEADNTYFIQYEAIEEKTNEAVSQTSIGLFISNGSVDVSLEWVTDVAGEKETRDFSIGKTRTTVINYRLNIDTGGTVYQPGELEITLPASQFVFSNTTGLTAALGFHKDHISLRPYDEAGPTDIYGYKVSADGKTLTITNKYTVSGAGGNSFEIGAVFKTTDRKYNGQNVGVFGRQVVDGTSAKIKFNVTDKTKTAANQRNFSTNELKVTLRTNYVKNQTQKWYNAFNPYQNWDVNMYGERPSDFENYRWGSFTYKETISDDNQKVMEVRVKDSVSVYKDGAVTPVPGNAVKIIWPSSGNSDKDMMVEPDGGFSNRTVNGNSINWSFKYNRNASAFYDNKDPKTINFHYLVGIPKTRINAGDSMRNNIETTYHDLDKNNTLLDRNSAEASVRMEEYRFIYPPGDTTYSSKRISYYNTSDPVMNPEVYYVKEERGNRDTIDRDMVLNVLKSGVDVKMRAAWVNFGINHAQGNTVPYSMEMYDDHTRWKMTNTNSVLMGPDDFYFSKIQINSDTLMPNESKKYNQPNGVVLSNLRVEYQDNLLSGWKEGPIIAPTVEKNGGTNPDGTKYDLYFWGTSKHGYRTIDLEALGIKAHRYRLVTVDENGKKAGVLGQVNVSIEGIMCFKGVNPKDGKETQLEKWFADSKVDTSSMTYHNFSGFKVEAKSEGSAGVSWTVLNPDLNPNNSRIPTDPGEYGNYLERREANATIGNAKPKAILTKKASQTNEVAEKRNKVKWSVNWAEGYETTNNGDYVIKDLFDDGSLTVPIRPKVVLTDLLPAGHTYADTTSVSYREVVLNSSQYTVEVVDPNYKDSGRQLVELTIDGDSVSEKSGSSYFRDADLKLRGNNVSWELQSNVTWGDRRLANENYNTTNRNSVTISLFDDKDIAQEMLADGLGRNEANAVVMRGLGNIRLAYLGHISGANDKIKNNMTSFGEIELSGVTSVQTGLTKLVKGNMPGAGFNQSDVGVHKPDGTYDYRLDFTSEGDDNNYIENVILFDRLEHVDSQGYTQGWKGTLNSVDLSYVQSRGIDAKVYISSSIYAPMFGPNHPYDFANYPTWIPLATATPQQIAATKSIAIDLRKLKTGLPCRFTANDYINVTIKMNMPDNFPSLPKAYNVPWLSASKVVSGITNDALTEGTYTEFELIRNPDLIIVKQDMDKPSTKLNGVTFEVEYPDGTKKDHTTSGQGQIKVTDLEPGKYKLREKSTKLGYEILTETYEFTVNQDRTITHQKDSTYWKYNYKDNTITLTVYNRRKFTLPFTGGSGVVINLLAIVAIVVVVGLGWYLKKYRFTA